MAQLLGTRRARRGRATRGRQPRDAAHGGDVRAVRRTSRPPVPRRPAPHRRSLLHELRCARPRGGTGQHREHPGSLRVGTRASVSPGIVRGMATLSARERASLPDRAFAYIDSHGNRRLPLHDESHVRNALARFQRLKFENDAAKERARRRLLQAAKRYGIVPVGFIDGQLRSERSARTPDFSTFPTGAVTFLMTDIERSTFLLQRLEDRYAGLLRDVRSLIRNASRRCGGRLVDVHGDGSLMVFERTASAVEAAVDVQHEMRTRSWPDDLDVRVRAGIHSGRPTLTETGYVGL